MNKKRSSLIGIFFLIALSIVLLSCSKPASDDTGENDMIRRFDNAINELGYTFQAREELRSPILYSDKSGNKIVFNSFYCSDPERIIKKEVSFYEDVFDPETADSSCEVVVQEAGALLCERDGRSYLLWYPDENTILMLDYDPNTVSLDEIIKMAGSCIG